MEKLDAAVRQEIVRIVDQWVPEGDLSRDAALVMVAALFAGPLRGGHRRDNWVPCRVR
jgi:hypothetical protein